MSAHFDQQVAAAISRLTGENQTLQRQLTSIFADHQKMFLQSSAVAIDMQQLMGQLKYALEEIETLKDRISDLEKEK